MNEAHSDCFKHTDAVNTRKIKLVFMQVILQITVINKALLQSTQESIFMTYTHRTHDKEVNKQTHKPYIIT